MLSEHPAPPKAPERVSIFTTPVAMLLRSFPEINLSVFPQGWWGAEAWKPTGLLALRLSKIHTSMNKWRLENPPTTFTPAIGRSSDGKFNTAALKEYPERFSYGMAQTISDELTSRVQNGQLCQSPVELPAPVERWVDRMLEISGVVKADAVMHADYQPQRT